MDAAQIQQATDALITATNTAATTGAQTIATNQDQLAPGLNTGQNVPGGMNYARNVAPAIDPLTTALTMGAQQAIFRQATKDATFNAQEAYDVAQLNYRARQRAYQEEQARRNRERRLAAERQAAADRLAAARAAEAQMTAMRAQSSGMIANQQASKAVVATPSNQLRVQPLPPQKISSVGVAQPGKISSVGVANPGKITSVGVARPGTLNGRPTNTNRITF